METYKRGALYIMSEECFDNYFTEHNYLDVPCFKASLSKVLGLSIIAASMLVKVPQIIKIVKNKSGTGISVISIVLNLTISVIHTSYSYRKGFPFSAWGEVAFSALQVVVIGALVLWYSGDKMKSMALLGIYATFSCIFMSDLVPIQVVLILKNLNLPIFVAAKIAQAYKIYKNGSIGQLSILTTYITLAALVARIFTSIQETGDTAMIMGYCMATILSGITPIQIAYYWFKSRAAVKGASKKSD